MSTPTLSRDVSAPLSTNPHLLRWVEKMADLTQPAAIHWVDGSQEEYDALCAQMVAERHASSSSTRSCGRAASTRARTPNDVARVEDRTFICSLSKDSAGPDQQLGQPVRDARAS